MGAQGISAAQLPEVRTQLVSDLRRELIAGRGPLIETFAVHVAAGAQPMADPSVTHPRAQARLLAHHERRRLAEATLWWVSPHMTALVQAAAPGMPPFRPTPADLPSAYGLIYFAAPIATAEETPVAEAVVFDDGTVGHIPGGTFQVVAASWGPWDYGGAWPGGTWFSFYTGFPTGPDAVAAEAARLGVSPEELAAVQRPLRLDNECVVSATGAAGDPDDRDFASRAGQGTLAWVHTLLTAFRLMATSRTATVTEQLPVRAARRRAARLGVTAADRPVRLLDVTTPPRRERIDDQGGTPAGRTYRVRWVVGGHWRQQWYPSQETHRPRYIDAYVKGPEGAPLKVPETVRVWRDPAEPRGIAGGGR